MNRLSTFDNRKNLILSTLFIAIFAQIQTAWIADDAAITLRTIDNLLHGYGPVFNIGERVQAYTHPLWFMLLSGASLLIGNIIVTAYLVPLLLSLTNLWLFLKFIPKNSITGVLGVVPLLLSASYLDYSTSGLENPLSHFLILLSAVAAYSIHEKNEYKPTTIFLLGSLLYLTRPDLIIAIIPIAAIVVHQNNYSRSELATSLTIGSIPAVAWTLFSIYYYGFPFPNTAYAKLGNGIPIMERMGQGLIYIIDSAIRDPVTMGSILTALTISLRAKLMERGLALGILLYLLFIVSIGGDFMSGRFLTAPLLFSAIIITKSNPDTDRYKSILLLLLILGGMSLKNTITKSSEFSIKDILTTGIADERRFYASKTGLAHVGRDFFRLSKTTHTTRAVEVTCGGLGFSGLRGGPNLHLIDYCGLADPLLARLPAKYDERWRIGHFSRQLPENYEASIVEKKNLLSDPEAIKIYDSLTIITKLPLNTPGRLKEIIKMNLVANNNKLDRYRFDAIPQDSETPAILYEQQGAPEVQSSADTHNSSNFSKSMEIVLRKSLILQSMGFLSMTNNVYLISMYFNGVLIPLKEIRSTEKTENGYFIYQFKPDQPLKVPTDRIRITAPDGSGQYIAKNFEIKEKDSWQ